MNSDTDWTMIFVVLVAFIAGYSIVSFVVKKLKAPPPSEETRKSDLAALFTMKTPSDGKDKSDSHGDRQQ